jgi:hypothetical protein
MFTWLRSLSVDGAQVITSDPPAISRGEDVCVSELPCREDRGIDSTAAEATA